MTITTQGSIKTSIDSMDIGDYIAANYTTTDAKTFGTFSNFGSVDTGDTSLAQFSISGSVLTGVVYLMKIDTGTLITNNVLFSGIVYKDMNTANLIVGIPQTIGGKNVLLRIPTIKELCTADSTLGGILDIADAFTNFDTAAANLELVQENFNLSQGLFTWSNTASATTSNAAANTATAYGRIVLLYPESSKATDVFH